MAKLNNKIQVSVSDLEQFKTLASQFGSLKKLNEELTAENSRLLTELDKTQFNLQKQRDTWDEYYPLLVNRNKKIEAELTSIKSKWWYKLMTWRWN